MDGADLGIMPAGAGALHVEALRRAPTNFDPARREAERHPPAVAAASPCIWYARRSTPPRCPRTGTSTLTPPVPAVYDAEPGDE
jgi:hypothetical protein